MIEGLRTAEPLYKYNSQYWAGHMYDDVCRPSVEKSPVEELLRRSDLGIQRAFAIEVISAIKAGQLVEPPRIFGPGETLDLEMYSPGTVLRIGKETMRPPIQLQSMYPRLKTTFYYGVIAMAEVAPNRYLRSLMIASDKDVAKPRLDPSDFSLETAELTVGNVAHNRRRGLFKGINVIEKLVHIEVSSLGKGMTPKGGRSMRVLLPQLRPI